MHLEDIAKWVESINNQVQQIQTLTAQLQQVQAYVKAFGDPEQAGLAARRRYEAEFTFERMFEQTLGVYQAVTGRSGR